MTRLLARPLRVAVATTIALCCAQTWLLAQRPAVPLVRFIEATQEDERVAATALREIAAGWKDSFTPMFVDIARLMKAPKRATLDGSPQDDALAVDGDDANDNGRRRSNIPNIPDRGSPIRRRLLAFLGKQTGKGFGDDLERWQTWMWTLPYEPHPEYTTLKGLVYGQVDPRMQAFFPPGVKATIRLDEVDWGGVKVNGIPPLRTPSVLPAAQAKYLNDANIVFGLVVNGEARAYPKRILAWHEMAIDRLGGLDLTIVYCTLCGTVIPYESAVGGQTRQFGTSGLLYQSNKLMFDEGTNSLWSTFEGVPVVGALVGSGLTLKTRPAVTTTWKEWRTTHPTTTVLSLDTRHQRDYSEGAAYRDYFATDKLMFQVSRTDNRLPNKAEVVVFRARAASAQGAPIPVALDAQFLKRHPVYSFTVGQDRYTVITSKGGANQVYRLDADIPEQAAGAVLRDRAGRTWRVTEDALLGQGDADGEGPRVSAQRAFWFGWYAQFPTTLLFK